ncbi:hypothetical protein Tco_0602507 [Tanacetum coccineum]
MSLKSLFISFGTQSRRSKAKILMNSFWPTRSAEAMLKSFRQELKVKNSLSYKMMMIPSPSSLTLAIKDFDFIPSHNDLRSDLDVSSPSGDRNKIYDPGIYIEVESTRFIATLSPVIDTFLSFSSENEDKVFNHSVLASKEKSHLSLSHRGFKGSKFFHHKRPMLIYGEDIPILDVLISPDYEAYCACGFVLRSLELQSFA